MANARDYVLIVSKHESGEKATVTPFPDNVIQNSDGHNVAPTGGTIAFISMEGTTKLTFTKGDDSEEIHVPPFDKRDDIIVRNLSGSNRIGVSIHTYEVHPDGPTLPLENDNTDIPYSMIVDVE